MSHSLQRVSLFLQSHPNGAFWLAFGLLNGLLFLPMAWIDRDNAAFPFLSIMQNGAGGFLQQLFLRRAASDLGRLSAEFTLITAVWVAFRKVRRPLVSLIFGGIYVCMLLYAVYEAIVVGIYLLEPSFYAQYFLVRDALPTLIEHLQARETLYLGGFLLLLASMVLILAFWLVLLRCGAAPRLSRFSRLMLAGLTLWAVSSVAIQRDQSASPEAVVSSFGIKLWENLRTSQAIYQRVQRLSETAQGMVYDYNAFPLGKKPNIYLIFVESYGSVLYQRPFFTPTYRALLGELEQELRQNGWSVATALSEAPTWGGGSWLSYTTTLFGMHIDQQPQYLELRDMYQTKRYPSLGATLHDQGYHYVWLSTLQENFSEEVWAKYLRLLSADELIRYKDLGYVGPKYGWGPSPPDQWTLYWVHEVLQNKTDQPLFLFTITQNSHYPYAPLPLIGEDWRMLNKPGKDPPPVDPQTIRLSIMRANYLRAIEYELRILTRWILDVGDSNSIFILIGDHQPPAVSRRADGYATPLHILSQDSAFVEAFMDYGFVPSLEVNDLQPSLRHEGFYSLFMRVLFNRYGLHQLAQPAYLPNGVEVEIADTYH